MKFTALNQVTQLESSKKCIYMYMLAFYRKMVKPKGSWRKATSSMWILICQNLDE